MNQEKIGKFIARKRKEKGLTQFELAEKMGVTDKSISNWENGKNMPDLSLFNPLCFELGITINELISGEEIEKELYQKKLEENIINVMIDTKRKNHKRMVLVFCIVSFFFIIGFIGIVFYNLVELDVNYDKRLMNCKFEQNKLTYEIKGISVLNTRYIEKTIDNKKYYVFHSTINLNNKRRSNFEYYESLGNTINNLKPPFGYILELDEEEDKYDNIIVYYTNSSLKYFSKISDEEFLNRLNDGMYKMCIKN